VTDFLLLGGLSLLLLPVALALPNNLSHEVWLGTTILALLINHPHFAHSYQLFYRGYRDKAFGPDYKRSLRLRYMIAGLAVPLMLAAFLTGTTAVGDLRVMGLAANAMGFFVGWHYVKQGYGMLIVDGVMRKQFFTESEKRVILYNSYAVWALTWLTANTTYSERSMFGVEHYSLGLPIGLLLTAAAITLVTSVATGVVFFKKWRASNGRLPVNGVVAYLVTLYLWMVFVRIDPIWMLVVPALHSLQYLTVVWRYEMNRQMASDDALDRPRSPLAARLLGRMQLVRFAGFVGVGIVLGLLGFWLVPLGLEFTVPVGVAAAASPFLFSFWIFINVHHYFIDNVMWRSENPDIKKYLFDEPRPATKTPVAAQAA
jgi:hypothetical protein